MERIRTLFSVLSRTEVKNLCAFLSAFPSRGENKALTFIALIKENPLISDEAMGVQLYGEPNSRGYNRLKRKLYEKMVECMTLSHNLQNHPEFHSHQQEVAALHIHKQLIQATYLHAKGLKQQVKELLLRTIKLTEKTNLPGLKALVATHMIAHTDDPSILLNMYKTEFEAAVAQFQLDIHCQIRLRQFHLLTGPHGKSKKEALALLEALIPDLVQQLQYIPSIQAEYNLCMLSLQHNLLTKRDWRLAEQHWLQASQMLSLHRDLHSPERHANLYLQKAHLELAQGRYMKAREAAQIVWENQERGGSQFLTAGIYLLYAYTYTGELHHILPLAKKLGKLSHSYGGDPHQHLIPYFELCHAFAEGSFRIAYHLISQLEVLRQDKGGWNVGLRLMEILIFIELDYMDLVVNKLENLRKHLQKYEANPRAIAAFKILQRLERNGFNFPDALQQESTHFQALQKQESWEPISYEVIRWDHWFLQKATAQKTQTRNHLPSKWLRVG